MKFILIDHSLKNSGGHHYDYARQILRVADDLGYEIVLGTHRRFRDRGELPSTWRVAPLFPHHTYSRFCRHGGWRGGALRTDGRLLDSPQRGERLGAWQRGRRLHRFVKSCHELFAEEELRPGDEVFIPTLSEFDLLAIVRFLTGSPATQAADWHLQFHFKILDGRETEYPGQAVQLAPLRTQMRAALEQIPEHRLHFYTTTEPLARQYNSLGIARFRALTYPIDVEFQKRRRTSTPPAGRPLRVTSAGACRPEKGQHQLIDVAADLAEELGNQRSLQLAIQCKPKRMTGRPRTVLEHPTLPPQQAQFSNPGEPAGDPIVYFRHPLAPDDYGELIRTADVGLLLYDSRRYYARHAGILGEYLSSGVPVVVPAGCWLSEQIAGEAEAHLEEISNWAEPELLRLPVEPDDRLVGHCTDNHPFRRRWEVPAVGAELLLQFHLGQPVIAGTYLQLVARQWDREGGLVEVRRQIVRERPTEMRALFHLAPRCVRVEVEWTNAYDLHPLCVKEIHGACIAGERRVGGHHPSSRVGIVAADDTEVATCLREISQHYDHYRQTSAAFSAHWSRDHLPERTVRTLLQRSQTGRVERARSA